MPRADSFQSEKRERLQSKRTRPSNRQSKFPKGHSEVLFQMSNCKPMELSTERNSGVTFFKYVQKPIRQAMGGCHVRFCHQYLRCNFNKSMELNENLELEANIPFSRNTYIILLYYNKSADIATFRTFLDM